MEKSHGVFAKQNTPKPISFGLKPAVFAQRKVLSSLLMEKSHGVFAKQNTPKPISKGNGQLSGFE